MRGGAAFAIFIMSLAGIGMSYQMGGDPEWLGASQLLICLCTIYLGAAALLMTSLNGLRIYAGVGFAVAVSAWIYCILKSPTYENFSVEFLTAISLEASGFMLGLLLIGKYLNWLYTPGVSDAA